MAGGGAATVHNKVSEGLGMCLGLGRALASRVACAALARALIGLPGSTFEAINRPLREPESWDDQPLKATTYYIYEGLKKLRAVHLRADRRRACAVSTLSAVALCRPRGWGQQESLRASDM